MNKKLILLVEDDPDISESLQITLRLNNFEVVPLFSGQGVVEFVESKRPDLIIMDVMMPPPDGTTVCRSLKSNSQTKHVPIVLLSARTQESEVELGFNAGADRYLSKPFVNEELLKTIAGLLGRP